MLGFYFGYAHPFLFIASTMSKPENGVPSKSSPEIPNAGADPSGGQPTFSMLILKTKSINPSGPSSLQSN